VSYPLDFMIRTHIALFTAPLVAALVAVCAVSCRQSCTDIPVADLTRMAPFKATVERVYVETFDSTNLQTVALVALRTEDGRRVSIGGERATPEMVRFVQSLQRGQTYSFPEVFSAYMKKQSTGR
jgi:hypothetical protein